MANIRKYNEYLDLCLKHKEQPYPQEGHMWTTHKGLLVKKSKDIESLQLQPVDCNPPDCLINPNNSHNLTKVIRDKKDNPINSLIESQDQSAADDYLDYLDSRY